MITLSYDPEEKFVYLKTNQAYSAEHVDEFLPESIRFAKQNRCFRILMDHRDCEFRAPIIEIHRITKNLAQYGYNVQYRGAVVYNQNQDKYTFADTVAHNWSMGVLRFFDDYATAKEWLLAAR